MNEAIPQLSTYDDTSLDNAFATLAEEVRTTAAETAADPERDLIRRIGWRRLTTLPTIAYRALRYT